MSAFECILKMDDCIDQRNARKIERRREEDRERCKGLEEKSTKEKKKVKRTFCY